MEPAVLDYKPYVQGNEIPRRTFTVSIGASPVSLAGAAIVVTFTNNRNTETKTIGNGVTVTNAAGGVFDLDAFTLELPGVWSYDITITFSSGSAYTYVIGTLKILTKKGK